VTTDTGTLFLALLTVAAELAIVTIIGLRIAAQFSGTARRGFAELRAAIGDQAPVLALVVAAVAMGGSLWLSEGAHFVPCKLCWYQRAAMYPLVPILAVAAIRRDMAVRAYALTLAFIGLTISAYHYVVERFPSLETSACEIDNPCTLVWVWRFHYVSIPLMAGTAFALIAAILLTAPAVRAA
jgi:disulfide bond formation protein DsbB